MYTPIIATTERDVSDFASANRFLDAMAELILAHHVEEPPTIYRNPVGTSMIVDWSDYLVPPFAHAHVEVQPHNGTIGSVWLVNAPRNDGTQGCTDLASHVGIAVGQLLTQFGMG